MTRIFLVEDDKAIAKNLMLLLRSEGFAVTHVPTRGEALDALAGNQFDLIPYAGWLQNILTCPAAYTKISVGIGRLSPMHLESPSQVALLWFQVPDSPERNDGDDIGNGETLPVVSGSCKRELCCGLF